MRTRARVAGAGIVVRPARPRECAAIAELDTALFPYAGLSPRQVSYYRRRSPRLVLVAVVPGGATLGFVIASVHRRGPTPCLHIVSMGVARSTRRKGLGRRLLVSAIRRGGRAGARRVRLEVWTGNRAAIGLYRSLGFGITRRCPDYYEAGRDAFLMQKPRPPTDGV